MMSGGPSRLYATIEVQMIAGSEGGLSTVKRLQRHMYQTVPDIRSHWGLDFESFGRNYLQSRYKNLAKWENVYRQLNREGTFQNSWTLRMGLEIIKE